MKDQRGGLCSWHAILSFRSWGIRERAVYVLSQWETGYYLRHFESSSSLENSHHQESSYLWRLPQCSQIHFRTYWMWDCSGRCKSFSLLEVESAPVVITGKIHYSIYKFLSFTPETYLSHASWYISFIQCFSATFIDIKFFSNICWN